MILDRIGLIKNNEDHLVGLAIINKKRIAGNERLRTTFLIETRGSQFLTGLAIKFDGYIEQFWLNMKS